MGSRANTPNALLMFTYCNPQNPVYLAENTMRTKWITWGVSCSISVPFLKRKHECLELVILIVIEITTARVIQVTSESKRFKTHKLGVGLSRYFEKCICCFQFFLQQWVVLTTFHGSLLLPTLRCYKYIQGVHMGLPIKMHSNIYVINSGGTWRIVNTYWKYIS